MLTPLPGPMLPLPGPMLTPLPGPMLPLPGPIPPLPGPMGPPRGPKFPPKPRLPGGNPIPPLVDIDLPFETPPRPGDGARPRDMPLGGIPIPRCGCIPPLCCCCIPPLESGGCIPPLESCCCIPPLESCCCIPPLEGCDPPLYCPLPGPLGAPLLGIIPRPGNIGNPPLIPGANPRPPNPPLCPGEDGIPRLTGEPLPLPRKPGETDPVFSPDLGA